MASKKAAGALSEEEQQLVLKSIEEEKNLFVTDYKAWLDTSAKVKKEVDPAKCMHGMSSQNHINGIILSKKSNGSN